MNQISESEWEELRQLISEAVKGVVAAFLEGKKVAA